MTMHKLKDILFAILNGTVSRSDISLLVHYCQSIAESYLLHYRTTALQLCERQGISLSDLSRDIIADIFERNTDGKFIRFDKLFHHLRIPLLEISEQELFIEFKNFIVLTAKTQVAKAFFQADPVWAKIYRNLKIHLQDHEHLAITEDFRGFVVMSKHARVNNNLSAFPIETLEQQLFSATNTLDTIPRILQALAYILDNQENYRRSIPMVDLVGIVRKIYIHDFDNASQIISVELSEDEIGTIQREIYKELDRKIFSDYVLKEKLDGHKAKILSDTLREIMTGWWSGDGEESSIAKITQRNFNISQKEYKAFYQAKIEYLVRLAKERFANYLIKDI